MGSMKTESKCITISPSLPLSFVNIVLSFPFVNIALSTITTSAYYSQYVNCYNITYTTPVYLSSPFALYLHNVLAHSMDSVQRVSQHSCNPSLAPSITLSICLSVKTMNTLSLSLSLSFTIHKFCLRGTGRGHPMEWIHLTNSPLPRISKTFGETRVMMRMQSST